MGLVQTSLTERCFLALTQAMKLGLGGSPTGPAGTGKTESVKALGAILGRLVLVFNCDEGNNIPAFTRFPFLANCNFTARRTANSNSGLLRAINSPEFQSVSRNVNFCFFFHLSSVSFDTESFYFR